MSKFKIGDRVINQIADAWFLKVGDVGTITKISGAPTVKWDGKTWRGREDGCYSQVSSALKLIHDSKTIVIYTKDNTTHAILKQGNQVIKRAQAICNPSDEFNFEIGANIAFQRLVGNEVKQEVIEVREVERPAKVGGYIKIVKDYAPYYFAGDVCKVLELSKYCGQGVYAQTKGTHPCNIGERTSYLYREEYVVLENYQPQ